MTVKIHTENHFYGFGLFRLNKKIHMLFIVIVYGFFSPITENVPASVEDTVIHRGLLSGFYTNGCLSAFVLRKRCHNGQSKFSVSVRGFDVIVNKVDINLMSFQKSCVVERINGVSRKTGYLTGDNHIKLTAFGVKYHLHKLRPFFSGCAGDTFVNIPVHNLPFLVHFQNRLVPVKLIFKSIYLRFVFGRDTGINYDSLGYPIYFVHSFSSFATVNFERSTISA